MKKLFFVSFFFLLLLKLSASNYKLIRLGSDLQFGYSLPFGLLVDSIRINAGDTTVFPKPVFFYKVDAGDKRFPLKTTPLGKCFIQKKNGMNFVVTMNDTFLIKSNTSIGEKWVMHKSGSAVIWAEVSTLSTEKILGEVEDSVKTITLTYTADSASFTKWSGTKIKLSKNFGLLSAFEFEQFPNYRNEISLLGMTNPSLGMQNLTWKEVWGMDAGDEIHVRTFSRDEYPWSTSSKYITSTVKKYLQKWTLGDTIFFKIDRLESDSTQIGKDPFVVKIKHDTIVEIIKPMLGFDNYPNVFYKLEYLTRVYNYGNNYFKVPGEWTMFICGDGDYGNECVFADGCAARVEEYQKNIGGPYYGCGTFWTGYSVRVVYSKIKETESGTKLIISGLHNTYNDQFATVALSPMSKQLTVNVVEKELPAVLTIFDLDGKVMFQQELWEGKSIVSLNKLNRGVFIFQLKGDCRQIKRGKIVVR